MKKKLLIVLLILSITSVLISGYVIITIDKATRNLHTLVQLHQVAVLREKMVDQIRIVQHDLHLKQTRSARDLATLVSHVEIMSNTIDSCFDCHHSREVTARLRELHDSGEVYKQALSRVYTIRANAQRLMEEENNAFLIGENLINDADVMLKMTNVNLGRKTNSILKSVDRSRKILTIFTVFLPLLIVGIAVWFYRNFTQPITAIVDATNKLKEGNLDFRITGLKDEFGDVAHSFNEMSHSLKGTMQNMMRAEQMVLMGEMASRLAHEIKNPITGIKLAAEVVRDEADLPEEFKDLCSKTINQIKTIEKLMKGLLNFARPPAPHIEMENLNTIIDTTFSTVEVLVDERSKRREKGGAIHLVKELDSEIPLIMTDASQVQQILLNLMLNALDAMSMGGTLMVRSSASPAEGFVNVDISDTGHGFGTQEAERIFQPFYSTKIKGTGLGLAIVTRLVDILGGEIHFTSEEGVGTTFTVCLPIEQSKGVEET
jgi:signal transduction histidine kinase